MGHRGQLGPIHAFSFRTVLAIEVLASRSPEPHAPWGPLLEKNASSKNAFFENAFFEDFANFWRVRSRLYQNEILQENMRLTACFKLYKICILLHRCNLRILAKNRFEKSAIFVKIQQTVTCC